MTLLCARGDVLTKISVIAHIPSRCATGGGRLKPVPLIYSYSLQYPHLLTMSNDGIPMSDEDMYGQRHPVENPDLIAAKLGELEEELSQLSDEDSQGWTQAKAKCSPDLINDDFKLMFLRCEVFNADVSSFLHMGRG